MYEKDHELNTSDEWIAWLSQQEEQRISIYALSPDLLIADYRRERQIARDYQGREILELLQNANDAAAEINTRGKVKLILSQEGMIIANTGKPFTLGGVQSLRISDLSSKRNKKNLIGNKGLGFRAVLNWSREPLILSGALSLTYNSEKNIEVFESLKSKSPFLKRRIEEEQSRADEIIIPSLAFPALISNGDKRPIYELCLELRSKGYDTVIGMPFDNPASFTMAKDEINLLKSEILLFIDNIEEFSLVLPDQDEIVWKIIGQEGCTKQSKVVSSYLEPTPPRKWHIFRKSDKIPSDYLDENNDTLQEYEIIIAVPDIKENLPEPLPLFSFFPTEVLFPYPVVCHATLELETNRKHPQASRVNKFILEEIATLLATVAECQSNDTDPWCKAQIIARTKDIDPFMVRFGFRERLLSEAKERDILPTLAQCYMKPKDIKLIEAKDLHWLPVEYFSDIVLPTQINHIKTLINELRLNQLPENDFRDRLNSIVFADLDSRVRVITGLITNDIVPKAPPPDLLVDEDNKIIKHTAKIYLPPLESGKKFDIPDWLNLRFINNELRDLLVLYLHVVDQRELRQKLSPFEVNEYALTNIASAIIAEVRRRIAAEPVKTKQYIQETLIALFLMYPEDDDPPKLVETAGIPLPNKRGTFTDARSLYFSADYALNGDLLEALYGHSCPENLLAPPENFDLGFNGANLTYNHFFKWLGVENLPREIVIERVEEYSFLGYILDSLKYPCHFEEYSTASPEDVKRPQLNKIKSIDHLEGILESDPAAILTWLAIDDRASKWRYPDTENATLTDRRGKDTNNRYYKGVVPSYIHWKIKNKEWLPVSEDKKAKPGLCMYGERALEKILPTPVVFKHPLFEKYYVDRLKLRDAWEKAGVLPNISFLTPKQIIEILFILPGVDPEGKSARALYRNILENIEADQHDWSEPATLFKKKGYMWGKGPDDYKYYPVNDLRHADTDDIPEQLINKINVVDLPKRVGAQKVLNIFGVEPIDRRKITVEISRLDESSRSGDIQYLFQTCKPYLYALRQVKTKQYQEINAFKRLNLILCRTIEFMLTYESQKLELSLAEPYQWILKEDQAYILEDPNEEASFRSDIFADSVGAILATILRLENGGDFARILRCESTGDRIKLLKRIVGETALPNIEELKKEFFQAGHQPIVDFREKEDLEISLPSTHEPQQQEQEVVATKGLASEKQYTSGEITVTKEEHAPEVTKRSQIALRKKTKTGASPITTMRRITDGDTCEEKVLLFEESEGRWPIKVSYIQGYKGPRCDVISFQTEGDWFEYKKDSFSKGHLIRRFIEVKGRSSESSSITIKGNELDAARVYAEQYYLYRLYEKNDFENVLLILSNPLEHKEALENIIEIDLLRATETEKYQLKFGEASEAIKEADGEETVEEV